MKFSSDPKILLSTLEDIVSSNNKMIKILKKKDDDHFNTYLDTYLFDVVFSEWVNNKRNELRSERVRALKIIRTVKVKNDDYSNWKGFISCLPFTSNYDVPYWVDYELNREAVDEEKQELDSRQRHINERVRSLKQEWRSFKEAIRNREHITQVYYGHHRYYSFSVPPKRFDNIIEIMKDNIMTIESFISRDKVAMLIDSSSIELSDDDITDLTIIVEYTNQINKETL